MSEIVEVVMPFVVVLLTIGAYFFGIFSRNVTHVMVPFKDPISVGLIILALMPSMMNMWHPEYHIDPANIWVLSATFGVFLGYIIGYITNQVDVIYVGVHQIVERTQSIEPIVRYTNKYGQTCWQPQSMWGVFRTLVFGIHNPLSLNGSIYRTRHVTLKTVFIKQVVDTVDLAGVEIEETKQKLGPFTFKIESRKYIPSPNCTDSPYDWIVRAQEYEDIFTQFSDLQMAAAQSDASIKVAQVKGGALMIKALSGKNPSDIYMDQLGIDMDAVINGSKRKTKKAVKKARQEEEEMEATEDE